MESLFTTTEIERNSSVQNTGSSGWQLVLNKARITVTESARSETRAELA